MKNVVESIKPVLSFLEPFIEIGLLIWVALQIFMPVWAVFLFAVYLINYHFRSDA